MALAGDVDHAGVRVERHRLDAHEHLACGSEDVQVDPFDVGYFDVER